MPGSHNRAAGAGHARRLTTIGRESRDAGFATIFHASASRAWPIDHEPGENLFRIIHP